MLCRVFAVVLLLPFLFAHGTSPPPFGRLVIKNKNGMEGWFVPFGGTLTHMFFPDKTGTRRDVVLGWDDAHQYRDNATHPYFGALIGRYANRIGGGTFKLNNFVYHTPLNENKYSTLHGGDIGYDRRIWTVLSHTENQLILTLEDGDLVEAFPGKLNVKVVYTISNENEWKIDYQADNVGDDDTIINLSQHTYWNLGGFFGNSATTLDHVLRISADSFTPVDDHLIPTGEIKSVKSVPGMDFRIPRKIGDGIPKTGYDYNFILNPMSGNGSNVEVFCPTTGINLEIFTTQPAVQYYSGTYLDGTIPVKKDQDYEGNNGFYEKYSAVVLETQHFPDSINHPNFPSTILKKGETYKQTTIYKLSVKK